MTWVLIVMVTINFGRGGGMIGSVPGFISQDECKRAGETIKVGLGSTLKDFEYVCVVQTKNGAPVGALGAH